MYIYISIFTHTHIYIYTHTVYMYDCHETESHPSGAFSDSSSPRSVTSTGMRRRCQLLECLATPRSATS